jgi:hypothetical protein
MSLRISNHYDSSYYVKMNSSAKSTKNEDTSFVSSQKTTKEYYSELDEKYPDLNIATEGPNQAFFCDLFHQMSVSLLSLSFLKVKYLTGQYAHSQANTSRL